MGPEREAGCSNAAEASTRVTYKWTGLDCAAQYMGALEPIPELGSSTVQMLYSTLRRNKSTHWRSNSCARPPLSHKIPMMNMIGTFVGNRRILCHPLVHFSASIKVCPFIPLPNLGVCFLPSGVIYQ